MAGRCYTELKRPKQGESLLQQAIAKYNHALVRENALYLSWLAEDYIQLGEIDQAAATAIKGKHSRPAALAGRRAVVWGSRGRRFM